MRSRTTTIRIVSVLPWLVIAAFLTALIYPRLVAHQGGGIVKSRSDIAELSSALARFRSDVGRYPSEQEGLESLVERPHNLKGWTGPYVDKLPDKDEWGNPYRYRLLPGGKFEIRSAGRDGEYNTDDDLTSADSESPDRWSIAEANVSGCLSARYSGSRRCRSTNRNRHIAQVLSKKASDSNDLPTRIYRVGAEQLPTESIHGMVQKQK